MLARALWLVGLVPLGCSDGAGRADLFATGNADAVASSAGTSAHAGAAATTSTEPPDSQLAGGAFSFGSGMAEPQQAGGGAAGALAAAGAAVGGAGGALAGAAGAPAAGQPAHGGAGSGLGGLAGAPATSELKACGEACKSDQDCRIGGSDYGFSCNPGSHRCETLGFPCAESIECLPAASSWLLDCASDADCFYFSDDVCVSVAGFGKCARLAPGGALEASGCEWPTADAVLLPKRAGGSAVVCADAGQRCDAGACVPACHSNADCTPNRNGSVCDTESGACRCAKDEDCGGPGVSRCNQASGSCECATATDCKELSSSDVCVAGRCGCSSVAACDSDRTFSGTQLVCE